MIIAVLNVPHIPSPDRVRRLGVLLKAVCVWANDTILSFTFAPEVLVTDRIFCLAAHRHENIRKVDVNVNVQTTRKPSKLSRELYWDGQGRHEDVYSKRLGQLPAVGCSDSLGMEIFRAASKIYYDHHNNAMVCMFIILRSESKMLSIFSATTRVGHSICWPR